MVFLEKQKKNGKVFYYLTQTIRVSQKNYKKIRHFIDSFDTELKEDEEKLLEIENLEEFEEILENHKPLNQKTNYKHSIFFEDEWELFSKEDLEEIKEIKKEYKNLQSEKNRIYNAKIREEFLIRHSYDTNKVEGSTFTLNETEALLTKGLILEPHKQREVYEISNISDAFDFIETYNIGLTSNFIKELHKEVTKNTLNFSESEGEFRKKGINVKMGVNPYKTVPGEYVQKIIKQAIDKFKINYKKSPLDSIVRFYVAFVAIHPFIDGNGRTSRMLLNYLLMQEGLPPINFLDKDHDKHIKYLNQAMNGDGFQSITAFIMNRIRLNHWSNR